MVDLVKRIAQGAWRRVAAALGITVFRTSSPFHVALDYPVTQDPRYGYKVATPNEIQRLIEGGRERHVEFLRALPALRSLASSIGYDADEVGAAEPFWNSGWLPPGDGAAILHYITAAKPKIFLEIGSGNSTKFARHAIRSANLDTKIISIDPQPRAEIDQICDRVIRKGLQDADLQVFDELNAGDILFFDGSHRVFVDSDVVVFFLEVMPRLPAGVIVHIHDIFWPLDYPPSWGQRYYSEQYMVGQLLILAADKLELLLANAYIDQDPELRSMAANMIPAEAKRINGLQTGGIWATGLWLKLKERLVS
jgi:hypothetical protein